MFTSHHCRHCRDKHQKMKPFPIKRRTKKQVYDQTKEFIINLENDRFSAEEVAKELRVKVHLVRQALHKLNLEGIVSQKSNNPPHDSTRDPWGYGSDSSWIASIYERIDHDKKI